MLDIESTEVMALSDEFIVNDVQSKLNATVVDRIVSIKSQDDIVSAVRRAHYLGTTVSICGTRHAMGGQQFFRDSILLDMKGYNRVRHFDAETGHVEVESGMTWSQLIEDLAQRQIANKVCWTIRQKQSGADDLTIGGAVSANAHGRGLRFAPIASDVERVTLVDANGNVLNLSRSENPRLFSLVVGGYGLFGVISTVTLRLTRRCVMERVVDLVHESRLIESFQGRINDGAVYGDFQFDIDERSDSFLRQGILSTYRPSSEPLAPAGRERFLSRNDWRELAYLAHTDRRKAFDRYSSFYLSTNGQLYSSDTLQLSTYLTNYHDFVDARMPDHPRGTEIITEIYVPLAALSAFLRDAGDYLRFNAVQVIYGTIRLIEKDTDTFLVWARERYACVIFNLHTEHSASGIAKSQAAFRHLIDLGIKYGGSYYLTYHKFATIGQLLSCYPQFREFAALKQKYDPRSLFQSNWYRHYFSLLAAPYLNLPTGTRTRLVP